MDAYNTNFAAVYDRFMQNIPYEEWDVQIRKILAEDGIEDGLVCELGCGTGTMTRLLAEAGYDMIGIDVSEDMLYEAREHQIETQDPRESTILYLEQDMRSFELYGTVRAVVAVCDTMNYLTEKADLVQTLKLVNNYLDPKGIFVFDVKTEHLFRDVFGNRTFAEEDDEAFLVWENQYDPDTKINEYGITTFIEEEEGYYSREDEAHLQRAYTLEEIKEAAAEAGMDFVCAVESVTGAEWTEETERAVIVLRENGKSWDDIKTYAWNTEGNPEAE